MPLEPCAAPGAREVSALRVVQPPLAVLPPRLEAPLVQGAVAVDEAAVPVRQPVAPLTLEAPPVGRAPRPSALLLVVLPLAHELLARKLHRLLPTLGRRRRLRSCSCSVAAIAPAHPPRPVLLPLCPLPLVAAAVGPGLRPHPVPLPVPPLPRVPPALHAARGGPNHRARAVRQVVVPLPLIRRLARGECPLAAAHPLGELALVDVAVGIAAQPVPAGLPVLKLARVDVAVGALAPPGLIVQVAFHKPAHAAVAVGVDNVPEEGLRDDLAAGHHELLERVARDELRGACCEERATNDQLITRHVRGLSGPPHLHPIRDPLIVNLVNDGLAARLAHGGGDLDHAFAAIW